MSHAPATLPRLVEELCAAARARAEGDGELLRRFVSGNEESAFAELVRRNGPLVLGVCRRVLRDEHAAEDAFQATFLVLARRARRLGGEGSLAGWLHAVAWRTARQARRAEERRRRHERQAKQPGPAGDGLAWGEVRGLIDAELMRLPERYRAAVVLCCLEDLPQAEAARRLGCSVGVLRGRLDRGRAVLRRRLGERGVSLAAVLLGRGEEASAALQAATLAAVRGALAAGAGVGRGRLVVGLLTLLSIVGASAGYLAGGLPLPRPAVLHRAAPPAAGPRLDRAGDPLPADAVFRLGTLRHRYPGRGFAQEQALNDGRTLLLLPTGETLHWIDTDTGVYRRSWTLPLGLLAAGFSADGRLALLHDGKRSLELWDLATRRKVRTLEDKGGLAREVWAVFSPDNRTVLVSVCVNYNPGLLRAHDVTTGRQLWQEGQWGAARGWWVGGFFPDGRTLVLIDPRTGGVSLRESATGKETRSFPTVGRPGFIPHLLPDGKTLLLVTRQERVRSWDMTTGKERPPLAGHARAVGFVAIAPDGRTVVTGGQDPFALVWDWPAGTLRRRINIPRRNIVGFRGVSSDGKRLRVLVDADRAARVFDLKTGKELPGYAEAHTSQVNVLATLPGGRVLSGGCDDTLRLWDLRTGRQVRSVPAGHRVGVMALAVSADGRRAATGDINEGRVGVFALPACRLVRTIQAGKQVRSAQFLGEGRQVLVDADEVQAGAGVSRRFLAVWDVDAGREVRRLKVAPEHWAVSPDGRLLAGNSGGRLRLYDVDRDRERFVLGQPAWSLAFAPDGRSLACTRGRQLTLVETASGSSRWQTELPDRPGDLTHLCFSPDGRWLAVARGPSVQLWDARAGRVVHTFAGHVGATEAVAFTPDGRRLVSSSHDTTLLVWDAAGVLARLPRPPRPDAAARARAWQDLASADAARAAAAVRLLIGAPAEGVRLLRRRLRPAEAVGGEHVARLLAGLDSGAFARREQASQELQGLGEQAESALEKFVQTEPSAEARRRAERLLGLLNGPVGDPRRLRALRAVEVVEAVGGPEARRLLETLAGGAPGARLTREAAAALRRLRR
jgi:RNA polymerase sigma factor (sigma-70 family)